MDIGNKLTGVIVDTVVEVIDVDSGEFEPAPILGMELIPKSSWAWRK